MFRLTTLAAATLLCGSFSAQAALIHWGAEAGTSVADCPSFCTGFNFGGSLGGENMASSGTSSITESRGSAQASAALVGGLNTPVLKAASAANPSFNGAFATAFGVQGYTYHGSGETLTLDVDLDGIVIDPELEAADTQARLEVVLYQPDPFAFFQDRGTLDFEFLATPLTQTDGFSEASVLLELNHLTGSSASGQIMVDVATGDELYVWALLRAVSQSGNAATSVDAFNTGTMSFLGNPELIPASAVPLPAGLWLLGSGLLALVGGARRRR